MLLGCPVGEWTGQQRRLWCWEAVHVPTGTRVGGEDTQRLMWSFLDVLLNLAVDHYAHLMERLKEVGLEHIFAVREIDALDQAIVLGTRRGPLQLQAVAVFPQQHGRCCALPRAGHRESLLPSYGNQQAQIHRAPLAREQCFRRLLVQRLAVLDASAREGRPIGHGR